jgi:hypothetical protein
VCKLRRMAGSMVGKGGGRGCAVGRLCLLTRKRRTGLWTDAPGCRVRDGLCENFGCGGQPAIGAQVHVTGEGAQKDNSDLLKPSSLSQK